MRDDPHTILRCYNHETGRSDTPEILASDTTLHRDYMDWCEGYVGQWNEMITAKGYETPRWDIQEDYHGKLTYHDWLKERVGL